MKLCKALLVGVLVLSSLAASAAKYNGEDRGRPSMPANINAKWQAECAGCHMAFPPGLLPAAAWKKLMSTLDKHFGTDASLSASDTQEIADFLLANPSNRWSSKAAPLRITESAWFKAKHLSGKISAAVWQRESVKSASNCLACHAGAAQGVFDEHSIRIPN